MQASRFTEWCIRMQRRVFITLLGAARLVTVLQLPALPELPKEQFTRTAVFFSADGPTTWRSFTAGDINVAQDMALDWLRTKCAHRDDRIEVHNHGGPGGIYV